ncbi:MAG: hypothetical protein GXY64_05040 [Bacteroidales bacterium]|nr:hypothetical protein [Bacteroidales bacterium]
MKKIQIEGVATISNRGFQFESGMPSDEPVLDKAMKMRGQLKIHKNADVEFKEDNRVYLPPEVHKVGSGEGYHIKRTTRHYIVTLKMPVVESREASEDKIRDMVPQFMGDITLDRQELINGEDFRPFGYEL